MNGIYIYPRPDKGNTRVLFAFVLERMSIGLVWMEDKGVVPCIDLKFPDGIEPLLDLVITNLERMKQAPQVFIDTAPRLTDVGVLFQTKLPTVVFLEQLKERSLNGFLREVCNTNPLSETHLIFPAESDIVSEGMQYFLDAYNERGSFFVSVVENVSAEEGTERAVLWRTEVKGIERRPVHPSDWGD